MSISSNDLVLNMRRSTSPLADIRTVEHVLNPGTKKNNAKTVGVQVRVSTVSL